MNFLMSVEADLPYNLRVGYSFDVIGRGLYSHLGAAHEIQIGFDFGGSTTIFKALDISNYERIHITGFTL